MYQKLICAKRCPYWLAWARRCWFMRRILRISWMLTGGRHEDWLRSRPPQAECAAIAMMIRLCSRNRRARAYRPSFRRLKGLPLIEEAQAAGTSDHGGDLSRTTWRSRLRTFPTRDSNSNARPRFAGRLLSSVSRIGMVVSDHSPSPPEMKHGDFTYGLGRNRVAGTGPSGDGDSSRFAGGSRALDGAKRRRVWRA